MNSCDWRYAFASVVGSSHVRANLPCQDACSCKTLIDSDGNSVLVAVVSDGAGSAAESQVGAYLACAMFIDEVTTLFEMKGHIGQITREYVCKWLKHFQHEIDSKAISTNHTTRDYACTFLAVVIGMDSAVFVQIGDGAIVVQDPPDNYCWVFWPQKGEYENQTHFATDVPVCDHLDYGYLTNPPNEVALFSDGIQRMTLHMETQTAHAPFFRPIFAPLRVEEEGHSQKLSSALQNFLASERVEDQTDDDKTLVLATRYQRVEPKDVAVDES